MKELSLALQKVDLYEALNVGAFSFHQAQGEQLENIEKGMEQASASTGRWDRFESSPADFDTVDGPKSQNNHLGWLKTYK